MKENWDKLKKTAEGFGSDLDTLAAWERFEGKKKKRRGFLFYLSSMGGLLALGLFIIYFIMPQESKDTSLRSAVSQTDNLSSAVVIPSKEQIILDQPTVTQLQVKTNLENSKQINSSEESEVNENVVTQLSTSIKSNGSSKNKLTPSKEISTELANSNYLSNNNNNSNRAKSETREDLFADKKTATSPIIKKTITPNTTQDQEPSEAITNKLISPIALASIGALNIQFLAFDKTKVNYTRPMSKAPKKQFQWIIDEFSMIVGYGLAERKLDGDNTAFIQRRAEYENLVNHMYARVQTSTPLKNNFSIEYGLGANRYQSRLFEVTQDILPNVLFEDELIEERTRNGSTTQVFGDVLGSQTLITEYVRYQQYFDINAVVQLGYTFHFSDRLSAKINSGLAYRFVGINHGKTFASEFSYGEYSDLSELGYKTGSLVKSTSDLRLSYSISDHKKLNVGVNYQFDLSNRVNTAFKLDDRFSSRNIFIGYTITL